MPRSALRTYPILAFGAALALVLASAARADQAWDQAAATGIAKQLVKDAEAWRLALRQQPDSEWEGSGESQDYDSMVQKSETLLQMAEGLAKHLATGDGMEKTRDMFRSLKEVVDDTAVEEAQSFMDAPTLAAWRSVKADTNKLAPYYGVKPQEP